MPLSLQIFLRVAAALLAMALFLEAVCRYMFHGVAPYNSPLLYDPFPDLLTLWPRFQHFHTLQFFTDTQDPPCMYPAPVAVCYRVFFTFVPHELRVFLCFVLLCAVVATFLFGRALIRRGLTQPDLSLLWSALRSSLFQKPRSSTTTWHMAGRSNPWHLSLFLHRPALSVSANYLQLRMPRIIQP
jgi:hypothetical protein